MPLWPSFVGGAYRTRSPIIAASTLVNLYLEQTDDQANVKRATLYGTPGLRHLFNTTGGGQGRGSFQQDGRIFSVVGAHLWEFDWMLTTATLRGTMLNDGLPVTFASNGRGGEQLAVCGAGELYILRLTTNVFTGPIALPGAFVPVMIDYIDGYFLMNEANTPKIWFSALEDGTSWNGLDFFARSETSDNIIGFKVLNNRVWALGSQTSELFYNTGDNLNPFAPFPGTVMQEGCAAWTSIMVIGESLVWLAQDNQGTNRFVLASSPQPEVISTPATSYALQTYPNISDCEVLAYEQEGHPFICWTFPSSPLQTTWCFDVRTKEWHQRQGFDEATGLKVRWKARGLCVVGQTVVVGDYATDDVYALDLETFTDNGGAIERERTAPYIGTDNQQLFLDQFELGMEAGVGLNTGQGSDPKLMLDVSWDGAKTWGPVTTAGIGAMGNYGASAVWHQLGSGRQDRLVVRVRQTDPVRVVWGPGAWVRVTPGTGQR